MAKIARGIHGAIKCCAIHQRGHAGIFQQIGAEILGAHAAQSLPGCHGAALHGGIGIFAAHARLGQRQQHLLAMHHATQAFQIGLHARGIDGELFHHAGQAHQREIECNRRIRANHAFHR